MNITGISIIIPLTQNSPSVTPVINQFSQTLPQLGINYEILLVGSPSEQHQQEILQPQTQNQPISLHNRPGKPTKVARLLYAFNQARFNALAIVDPAFSYPIDTLPEMLLQLMRSQADILIAQNTNRSFSASFFGTIQNQSLDIHSGLKVFKKEIVDRLYPRFSPVAFDLEFLVKASDAGYKIGTIQVPEDVQKAPTTIQDSFSQLVHASLRLKSSRSEVIPFHPDTQKEKGEGFHYKGQEFVHHSQLAPSQTALHRLSGMQIFILSALLVETVIFFIINWHAAIVMVVAALTCLYFADLLFNLYLIYRSFSKPAEVEISQEEINAIHDWPRYTILCPLYKEWQVVPQFVTAMSHLDYPKDKLQVMLLLEEDDQQTIEQVQKFTLPEYFETVIVPDSKPKTKPKASNYGLKHATGSHIVIFDAEDIPDPLQLKKAVIAFDKTNKRTICIQAKLNFYNPHQNLLTRVFTAEYSLWFDLVLTGLQSIHAPIPLGGTSNHFRVADLHKLKGWDSFNVTEDCDLGMRLVKQGYQTAVINSTTLEEANSSLSNWFNQRTRWIKGYMQTYLIHMRDPQEFLKTWREPHAITFQLVVGGKVLSMFINPLMWIITICYFAFRAHIGTFIESFFPAPVLYMGVISLLLGNFLYVYYYMIGCAKHGHHELVKYGVFIPLYWLCMSIAAWMAVYKLIVAPHHWAKTKHGLHLNNQKAVSHASVATGQKLVDEKLTHIPINSPALSI